MAWQDRPYYGGGSDAHGYLGNPASILGLSIPFGHWGPVRVRLHFWMLLSILFVFIGYGRAGGVSFGAIHATMLIATCLLHEFGNRFAAQQVGGTHDDFMLWPAGGMIPPSCPPTPFATFLAHSGGVVVNLLIAGGCTLALWFMTGKLLLPPLNPLAIFGGSASPIILNSSPPALLAQFMFINASVMWAALMPFYWFKGAYILQGALWKWTGYKRAVNITCIVGMVVAAPMFLLSLYNGDLLGMVIWALLFGSSFSRRKQVQFEPEADYQDSLTWTEKRWGPKRKVSAFKRWRDKRFIDRRRQLQDEVDRILEKVSRDGMHSLSSREKKTLEQASRELKDD